MVACATFEGGFVSPMRVVLYARVATHDQQTLAMQIDAMRTCATRRGGTGTDAIEAWALVPKITAPSARSCSQRLGNASSRSCWCGSSTVGVSGQHHCDWVNALANGTSAYLRLKPVNGSPLVRSRARHPHTVVCSLVRFYPRGAEALS